jgi:hypothetical protein
MKVIVEHVAAAGGGGPKPRRWWRPGPSRAAGWMLALASAGAVLAASPAATALPLAPASGGTLAGPATRQVLLDQLASVSCPARHWCVAVGVAQDGRTGQQMMLAERWNGLSWSVMPLPTPTSGALAGVSCTSARACTAVGMSSIGPLAERWNGHRWHTQPIVTADSGGVPLAGVSCGGKASCTAVGYAGSLGVTARTLAARWDGHTWALQPTPPIGDPGSDLFSVSCPSASVCTAVGDFLGQSDEGPGSSPLAMRWQAGGWSIQPTPDSGAATGNVTTGLTGVSCPVAGACTAVGESVFGGPLVVHWDGTTWRRQQIPGAKTLPPLTAVSCPAATACTAVGGHFTPIRGVAEHWNGIRWTRQFPRLPTGANAIGLAAVSCSSARHCTAAGVTATSRGWKTLAERWNGRHWAIQATPNPAPA